MLLTPRSQLIMDFAKNLLSGGPRYAREKIIRD